MNLNRHQSMLLFEVAHKVHQGTHRLNSRGIIDRCPATAHGPMALQPSKLRLQCLSHKLLFKVFIWEA